MNRIANENKKKVNHTYNKIYDENGNIIGRERVLKLSNRKLDKVGIPKEQKRALAAEAKKRGLEGYLAEMRRQQSEREADIKASDKRKEERKRYEKERLERLAEKRKNRKDRLIANDLKQANKIMLEIERFKRAEELRKAKKKAKYAKYHHVKQCSDKGNNRVLEYSVNLFKINKSKEFVKTLTMHQKIKPSEVNIVGKAMLEKLTKNENTFCKLVLQSVDDMRTRIFYKKVA